ncbi:MAG: T9SS type A sorting domain-containing protein [Bacteroidetes bacterium]|nr:T9SS type A sorting domain-containing protein [Bacteroidota bacterium]
MKKALIIISILIAPIFSWAQTPLATYLLDNNGKDTFGKNDLTLNNITYGLDIEGVSDKAAHFNGTSSYAQIPAAIFNSQNPYEFRLSLWFKTKSKKGQGLAFAGKETVGSSVTNYTPILYLDTFGKLNTFIYDGGVTPVKSTAAVNDDKWHHAMVVYSINGTSGALTQQLYLDGKLAGTKSGTIGGSPSFKNLYLGACCARGIGDVPSTWMYFDGEIDEVNIYNSVLSSATWSNFMFKLTSMPASQKVKVGDSVKFSISHTNFLTESFTYAWKKNGSSIGTNSILKIASTSASDTGSYTCEVTNANGRKLISQVAVLSLGSTSGIADNSQNGFSFNIYPNPASHFLQINSSGNYPFGIKDLSGKELMRGISNEMIFVEKLPAGIYLLELNKNGQNSYAKFIKQ